MPKSRSRKKDQQKESRDDTSSSASRKPMKVGSPSWIAPAMVGCWVVGLLWIVVFYLAGTSVPVMSALGNWNLLVGMGLIAAGFMISTKWE